jgi:ATP phosphoribosyltransferase regulatory subunit
MHRRLSLPTGTETLRLREAARQRQIARQLEGLFEAWGYAPVETPLVDYFEVYRRLLSDSDVRQIYRAVDRQGEILALRSDTTIFLAKQLGLYLSPDELPVRVYYSEQIVRAEEEHDISSNEYQQAGVELVGLPGSEGDAEILTLAVEALHALGVTGAALHVGSHSVLEEILLALSAGTQEGRETLRDTLPKAMKARVFDTAPFSDLPTQYRNLLRFMGSRDELEEIMDRDGAFYPPDVTRALEELLRTIRLVEEVSGDVRIDFSELGTHGYYTGLAFAVYLPDNNTAVLQGGRYDRLLVSFGIDAPSVGFSMFPRKLPLETMAIPADPSGVPQTLKERLRAGREVRK